MSGPYLLKGLGIFIITLYDSYQQYVTVPHTTLNYELPRSQLLTQNVCLSVSQAFLSALTLSINLKKGLDTFSISQHQ